MSGRASAMAGRSSARGASHTSDHNTRGRRASPPSSRGSAAAPEDSDGPESDDLISHPEGKGKGQGGGGGGPTRPRSPGDGDEDEEETLSSSPPAPLPHAAPRKKPRAATITQTMSAAQIADCVTKVCGATMVAALWGTLTARMPAQPMQTLQLRAGRGTSKGRRSSGGSATSGDDETSAVDAHLKSRIAVQQIFLPVCSAMVGPFKTKYNLGEDPTRTTVGGNAFLHAAFLCTAVLKGQTREEFREEFLRSVTNMRSGWNKEIRQGLRVFCCALFNMVLDMDSNVLEDDEAPADLAELVSESKKLADRMSHREPAVSTLMESALARVLKGHTSEYPGFEWVDALDDGKGDTARSFYEYLFKPLIHSALTGINLFEETRDRAGGVEPPQLREEATMKVAAWATLEKGGGVKNASFTEDMWATFLTFWTAKKRPMHGLLKVRLETIETADLVAFVKPYTGKPGESSSASELVVRDTPPSEDAAAAPMGS